MKQKIIDVGEGLQTISAQQLGKPQWTLIILTSVFALGAACQLLASSKLLLLKADSSYHESGTVYSAIWTSSTGRVYPDLNAPPFTPSLYGPLTYIGLGLLYRAFPNIDTLQHAARFLVFACYLAVALVVFRLSRRSGATILFALLSALAVLSEPAFRPWNATVHPEVPCLLLVVLALYISTFSSQISVIPLLFSGFILACALLLKQSYIVAPLTICIWLASKRRWRGLIVFALAVTLPGAAVVAALLARHEPIFRALSLLRSSVASPITGLLVVASSATSAINLLLFSLGIAGLLVAWRTRDDGSRLFVIYFLLAWTLPPLAIAVQIGAAENYLLEGWIACALLLPFALQEISVDWQRTNITLRAAVAVVLAVSLVGQFRSYKDLFLEPNVSGYGNTSVLRNLTVLSSSPYFGARSREPVLLDPYANHILEISKKWSPALIISSLERQYYDVIVIGTTPDGKLPVYRGERALDDAVLAEIKKNYRFLCKSSDEAILCPSSRIALLDVAAASSLLGEQCRDSAPQLPW